MATTYVQENTKNSKESGVGFVWSLITSDADIAAATSGDLIIWNNAAGIALSDYDTDNTELVVDWAGAYDISVVAESAAVEVLDKVYYDAAADEVNDDNSGILVGIALEGITNGATSTIAVKFTSLGVSG